MTILEFARKVIKDKRKVNGKKLKEYRFNIFNLSPLTDIAGVILQHEKELEKLNNFQERYKFLKDEVFNDDIKNFLIFFIEKNEWDQSIAPDYKLFFRSVEGVLKNNRKPYFEFQIIDRCNEIWILDILRCQYIARNEKKNPDKVADFFLEAYSPFIYSINIHNISEFVDLIDFEMLSE